MNDLDLLKLDTNNVDIKTSIKDALVWKEKDGKWYQEIVHNCEVTEYTCK